MSQPLVALDLHGRSVRLPSAAHVERLLNLLGAAFEDPGAEKDGIGALLEVYRTALATGTEQEVNQSADALFAGCDAALERSRSQRTSVESDLADLLNIFREMAVTVSGEGAASASQVTDAAARFAALAQVHDVRLLKQRLQDEVAHLREVAHAHEQKWQSVVDFFSDRVSTLEAQLTVTRHDALCDALTGVANRRAFDDKLQVAVRTPGASFTLALVDVDDFKKINDQQGHDAGDLTLQAVANILTTSVRDNDTVSRIGGDEFAVIIQNVTLTQGQRRMAELVETVNRARDEQPRITLSCGLAEYSAGDTTQSLLKRADEALYEAKRLGKGRAIGREAPLIRDLRRV